MNQSEKILSDGDALGLDVNSSINMKEPVHRWYALIEGFSGQFVRYILRHFKARSVLDPFVGAGTTLVEAKLLGVESLGVEINPFLCFVSRTKIREYKPKEIVEEAEDLLMRAENRCEPDTMPPPIPRFWRYYSPEIAQKLLILKEEINRVRNTKIRDLFLLFLSKIAVQASNAKRSPAPRFNKRRRSYPVLDAFKRSLQLAIQDIRLIRYQDVPTQVMQGDSRNLSFLADESFDLVLTSPPYCNNLDYVRHTQLELFWLNYAASSKDLGKLRKCSITSCEAMAHADKDPKEVIEPVRCIAEKIKKKTSRRWPRMVMQYFKGMEENLKAIKHILKSRGKAVYVVGDSWIKGVHVPTPHLLVVISKKEGYKVSLKFIRERKSPRHHHNPLKEYLLILTKGF
jgi:DNA modification methylase